MLPSDYTDDFTADFSVIEPPTKTYRLNFSGKPSTGMITGVDAMRQAVFLILHTERFDYKIFSWDYGVHLSPLIGENISYYLQAQLQQAIEESLLQDDRIMEVCDFVFERPERGVLSVKFTVKTTQGDIVSELKWGV